MEITSENIKDLLKEIKNIDNFRPDDYFIVPSWGPETELVSEFINSSCDFGDIVSWDTTDPDPKKHLFLRREENSFYLDCGEFWKETEDGFEINFDSPTDYQCALLELNK